MLTVAELLEELKFMPPESTVEVWYPADARGAYDVDVDVKLLAIHDHDQLPVAIAICASRPLCADQTGEACWYPADVELTDRTGHRHPLCADHAAVAWDDPGMRVTAVYGGPGAAGWAAAAGLLAGRWPDEPAVAAWVAHPARWVLELPAQPIRVAA